MLLNDLFESLGHTDAKYLSYIVYVKKTESVLYHGFDVEQARKHESSKTATLEPMKKHTISAEQMRIYQANPSLYSW